MLLYWLTTAALRERRRKQRNLVEQLVSTLVKNEVGQEFVPLLAAARGGGQRLSDLVKRYFRTLTLGSWHKWADRKAAKASSRAAPSQGCVAVFVCSRLFRYTARLAKELNNINAQLKRIKKRMYQLKDTSGKTAQGSAWVPLVTEMAWFLTV